MAEAFAFGLRSLTHANAVAVASRSPDRARDFAGRLGIPTVFGSFDQLVDCPDVDIIYIATPNHLHREHMLLALDAGKPVLCEKPFALNGDEAREVVDRARSRGLFCMEAMWTRFVPAMTRLRSMVRDGSIGQVQMLSAQMGYPYVVDPDGRLWNPSAGGGVLLDLGVYLVALAIDLLGPVEGVVGDHSAAESGVDDRIGLVLRHPGGRIATLSASLTSATGNDALVSGDRGLIRVHEPFYRPERLSLRPVSPINPGAGGGGSGRLARLKGNPLVRSMTRRVDPLLRMISGSQRGIVVPHVGNGYQYQAAEAGRCLREGLTESPIMPLDQSVAILDVLDQVRRQWASCSLPTS
jgi:predicted dehydrogenase